MNTTAYRQYISKRVFIALKNNIVFNGIINDVTDYHIVITDKKIGLTTISIPDIVRIELRNE
jgi:hypothetical protein